MREQVLDDIEETIMAISEELRHSTKDWFEYLALEKWALMEIRDLIIQKPDDSPWRIVADFMDLMDKYTKKPHANNYVFIVAYDTAWSVLSEIIGGCPPD